MTTWDAPVSRVVVVTGAGISAESGVATYRATGSGWTNPDLERMSQSDRYGQHLPALWEFWEPSGRRPPPPTRTPRTSRSLPLNAPASHGAAGSQSSPRTSTGCTSAPGTPT